MKQIILAALFVLTAESASALSPVERAAIWTRCWETIRCRFTGFDEASMKRWESDFHANLRELTAAGSDTDFWRDLRLRVASLGDGQTWVRLPGTLPRVYDTVPIRFVVAGDIVLVKELSASPDVQSSGIRVGDELVTVDHTPAMDHLLAKCYPHVSGSTQKGRVAAAAWRLAHGPAGSRLHLGLRRPDGREYSVSLLRDSGPDNGYLRDLAKVEGRFARKFRGSALYLELGQRLTHHSEQAVLDMLAENPGTEYLILDLRDARDGIVPVRILEKLALFPLPIGGARERAWTAVQSTTDPAYLSAEPSWRNIPPQMVEPQSDPYRGKVIALVSAETAGPAERFLEPLIFAGRVTLVGDTTAGAGGQSLEVQFGADAALLVTVRQPNWEDGYGAGKGFPPRIYAVPAAKGLAAGKDDVLDRALTFINEQAN